MAGQGLRGERVLLDVVEAPAVHLPGAARDPRCGARAAFEGHVERDEVEGGADPADAGDQVRPAQQQVQPVGGKRAHVFREGRRRRRQVGMGTVGVPRGPFGVAGAYLMSWTGSGRARSLPQIIRRSPRASYRRDRLRPPRAGSREQRATSRQRAWPCCLGRRGEVLEAFSRAALEGAPRAPRCALPPPGPGFRPPGWRRPPARQGHPPVLPPPGGRRAPRID